MKINRSQIQEIQGFLSIQWSPQQRNLFPEPDGMTEFCQVIQSGNFLDPSKIMEITGNCKNIDQLIIMSESEVVLHIEQIGIHTRPLRLQKISAEQLGVTYQYILMAAHMNICAKIDFIAHMAA